MNVLPFIIAAFGFTASFIVWASKLYAARKLTEIPELMYVFTFGALLFAVISIAFSIDHEYSAVTMRWVFASGGIGFLFASIRKGK